MDCPPSHFIPQTLACTDETVEAKPDRRVAVAVVFDFHQPINLYCNSEPNKNMTGGIKRNGQICLIMTQEHSTPSAMHTCFTRITDGQAVERRRKGTNGGIAQYCLSARAPHDRDAWTSQSTDVKRLVRWTYRETMGIKPRLQLTEFSILLIYRVLDTSHSFSLFLSCTHLPRSPLLALPPMSSRPLLPLDSASEHAD